MQQSLRELCERLGFQADIELVPWRRALALVKAGKADGILMPIYTPERANYLYFTEESPGSKRISVMARHGGLKAASLDELTRKTIGTALGYS